MQVEVRNGNVDRAIRTLKRKLAEDGMFRELQERSRYEKPSDRRRRVKRASMVRQRKATAERMAQLNG